MLMLNWIVFLCTIFVSQSKQLQDFEPRGKSIRITPPIHSDELSDLLTNTDPFNYFIYFYAPWCRECKNKIDGVWNELANEFDFYEGIRILSIDCTGGGERACIEHNVLSYPHLLEISQSENMINRKNIPFWGKRNKENSLREWIITNSPQSLGMSSSSSKDTSTNTLNKHNRSYTRKPIFNTTITTDPSYSSSSSKIRCLKWRGSIDCDPEGEHDPSKDLSCLQPVLGNRAGYCECDFNENNNENNNELTSSRSTSTMNMKLVDCGHEHRKAFTCLDICDPVIGCEGWKATKNCFGGFLADTSHNDDDKKKKTTGGKPAVIREPPSDKDCRTIISKDWSGFCDCGDNIEIPFNCSSSSSIRSYFTCEDKCKEYRKEYQIQQDIKNKIKIENRLLKISKMKSIKVISMEDEEKEMLNLKKQEILKYKKEFQSKLNEEIISNELKLQLESEVEVHKEINKLKQEYDNHEKEMMIGILPTIHEITNTTNAKDKDDFNEHSNEKELNSGGGDKENDSLSAAEMEDL